MEAREGHFCANAGQTIEAAKGASDQVSLGQSGMSFGPKSSPRMPGLLPQLRADSSDLESVAFQTASRCGFFSLVCLFYLSMLFSPCNSVDTLDRRYILASQEDSADR